jgi:hypothetical protein
MHGALPRFIRGKEEPASTPGTTPPPRVRWRATGTPASPPCRQNSVKTPMDKQKKKPATAHGRADGGPMCWSGQPELPSHPPTARREGSPQVDGPPTPGGSFSIPAGGYAGVKAPDIPPIPASVAAESPPHFTPDHGPPGFRLQACPSESPSRTVLGLWRSKEPPSRVTPRGRAPFRLATAHQRAPGSRPPTPQAARTIYKQPAPHRPVCSSQTPL